MNFEFDLDSTPSRLTLAPTFYALREPPRGERNDRSSGRLLRARNALPRVHPLFLIATTLLLVAEPLTWARGQSAAALFDDIPAGGLPLAQISDSNIPDKSALIDQKNRVYFVWGATAPEMPPGVLASRYFPSFRDPRKSYTHDPTVFSWYKINHPDWIEYQADRTTPAYGFLYQAGMPHENFNPPLDIGNPEVRSYYLDTFIMPAIKAGYRAVAMDNVGLGNGQKASGHYSKDGKWIQQYAGTRNDPKFEQDVTNWMRFLSEKLHPLGVTVIANIKLFTAEPAVVHDAISAVDGFLYEGGFLRLGVRLTDDRWRKAVELLQNLPPTCLYIPVAETAGDLSDANTSDVEWAIANFLLLRGPKSLFAIEGSGPGMKVPHRFIYRSEMDVDLGKPVAAAHEEQDGLWSRSYERGLVLINPSSTTPKIAKLPKGEFITINGVAVRDDLTVPPATSFVLSRQEPPTGDQSR